jgi:hypothetical protein
MLQNPWKQQQQYAGFSFSGFKSSTSLLSYSVSFLSSCERDP